MKRQRNPLCAISGLAFVLLLLTLLLEEAVGSRQSFNERSDRGDDAGSHTRLWKGETPSNQQDGRLIFDLEEDYFDNSDPYVMGGSEDIPVHRPFVPFDPSSSLPGIIRRPVSFERNVQTNPRKPADSHQPPRHSASSSASGTHRRPHAAPEEETSWRWPSDTVRPESKHTTRPATVAPQKSVTHAQVFLRPEDVPSIRLPGGMAPSSHHVVSSHQDGEVNYLNRQLGESIEDHAPNSHQQQQSHESTQVQVVESVGLQPAKPASDEEVYGLSGELSTLDHVAKTTPMQNGLTKGGGNDGDSVENPTTNTITNKDVDTTSSATGNVQTSVLSSIGLIIQQSAEHTAATKNDERQFTPGNPLTSNQFSSITEETPMRTIRPPIYRTTRLGEVTHYIPSSISVDSSDTTQSRNDEHTQVRDSTIKPDTSGGRTQAMTVVTRKSIKVSTSDDATSREVTDGSEETETTTDILGVRVKFTMSGEDERFTSSDDSTESDIAATGSNDNTPIAEDMPSTHLPLPTTTTTTERPTVNIQFHTTAPPLKTATNVIATSRVTNSKPTTNTVTRISTTRIVTNSSPTINVLTRTTPTTTKTTTTTSTTPKITSTTSTTTTTTTKENTVTQSETTHFVTSTEPIIPSVTNKTATPRVTGSSSATTRQGKAIHISIGNRISDATRYHNFATEIPNLETTSLLPRHNSTYLRFNESTTQPTSDIPNITTNPPDVAPSSFNVQTPSQSSSENTVFAVTTQDIVPPFDNKNSNTSERFVGPTTSISIPRKTGTTTTTRTLPTTTPPTTSTNEHVTVDKPTDTSEFNETLQESVATNTSTLQLPETNSSLPELNKADATTTTTSKTVSTKRTTTKRTRISTHANRPFVLPTAPSVLDDPNLRDKLLQSSVSSEIMDTSILEKFSLPTAPSVITDPTVERATIRHRLRRPQLSRTTPGSLWRPTVRSRTNTVTFPAITPYPTRSTTSPQPDLRETMAPPVVRQDDNHHNSRELEPPDIHKFFEEDKDVEETTLITPAATNTIIISGVIGGCAILFFFCLMIFCMCKQKKLRRARYRQPPDYDNVFVGKYS